MTTMVAAEWIKRIAEAERTREAERLKESEIAAKHADLVRRNGRRLIDEIRSTVTRDVDAFRAEFPGDVSRDIVVDVFEGGFTVRKPAPSAVVLAMTPNADGTALACHYRFSLTDGLPPREDRFDMVLAGDAGETLRVRHHGTGQLFSSSDALSEFLLVPVFTGRPREMGRPV